MSLTRELEADLMIHRRDLLVGGMYSWRRLARAPRSMKPDDRTIRVRLDEGLPTEDGSRAKFLLFSRPTEDARRVEVTSRPSIPGRLRILRTKHPNEEMVIIAKERRSSGGRGMEEGRSRIGNFQCFECAARAAECGDAPATTT